MLSYHARVHATSQPCSLVSARGTVTAGARRAAITDGVSALQLWSLSRRSGAVPRPKGCEGASFQPDGLSRCQSHPRRFSQQVMQRGRMLSDDGFGSICKAEFTVRNPGSSHIPPISLQPLRPGSAELGDLLPLNTAEVVGSETPGCRRRRDLPGHHPVRCGTVEPGSAQPPGWTRLMSIQGELKKGKKGIRD